MCLVVLFCFLFVATHIFKVGCLHGSPASGRDVQDVMNQVRPGVVVLELCDSRHKSLRRDLEKGTRVGATLDVLNMPTTHVVRSIIEGCHV